MPLSPQNLSAVSKTSQWFVVGKEVSHQYEVGFCFFQTWLLLLTDKSNSLQFTRKWNLSGSLQCEKSVERHQPPRKDSMVLHRRPNLLPTSSLSTACLLLSWNLSWTSLRKWIHRSTQVWTSGKKLSCPKCLGSNPRCEWAEICNHRNRNVKGYGCFTFFFFLVKNFLASAENFFFDAAMKTRKQQCWHAPSR